MLSPFQSRQLSPLRAELQSSVHGSQLLLFWSQRAGPEQQRPERFWTEAAVYRIGKSPLCSGDSEVRRPRRGGVNTGEFSHTGCCLLQVVWMPDHRQRLCLSGISPELQTLPSAKAGPELQPCRRPGSHSAVCQAESGLS